MGMGDDCPTPGCGQLAAHPGDCLVWVEWHADDDSIRVGYHPIEGWYAVTGRYRPMAGESGEGTVAHRWINLVGGVAARNVAEAFAP